MPSSPPFEASAPDPSLRHQEHRLTRLLAMSLDGAASPSIRLTHGAHPHGAHPHGAPGHRREDAPYGWGFAWYPAQTSCAMVIKDPTSTGENAMTKLLYGWERFESTVFVCHLRGAARTLIEQDTQPFSKSYAGRDFVLAHNGDLMVDRATALPLTDPSFEPLGGTDSEHAFAWLLQQMRTTGARRLAEIGWPRLHRWLCSLDDLGTANFLLTDGIDLCAYRDAEGYNGLGWSRLVPPHAQLRLENSDYTLDLEDVAHRGRSVVMVSTHAVGPLPFQELAPGQLLVFRRGALTFDSEQASASSLGSGAATGRAETQRQHAAQGGAAPAAPTLAEVELAGAAMATPISAGADRPSRPSSMPVTQGSRVLSVIHDTTYRYDQPVTHSLHTYRLRPCHDLGQQVLSHRLEISVNGDRRDYEDVFGNAATRVELTSPYQELRITSRSIVALAPPRTSALMAVVRRNTFPLVWMPWQRQMMTPYLLPVELPETQLTELSEFAMQFAARQDDDLMRTAMDINQTIHRDFSYVSGSTTLETTPFEVYSGRRGVCQDFANLLICLARLLGIPARYRVGYIFTGAGYENRAQGDASHAWAELYLPYYGWQGFDPTNGCLVALDHVRVACGRNYRDATPTAGTIYKGGGAELLSVEVRVEEA
ncbi:MAG: class II glutamine amidotransferase [Kofleriaceae bacterium]